MMTNATLVRGRWIIPGGEVPTKVLSDAAVAIEGDTILELDSWQRLLAKYPNAKVLGSDQHAVIPGLINTHHHSYGVPHSLHGIEDALLESWLLSGIAMRQQDPYLRTLFSAAYLLRSGVTTVLDVASISSPPEAVTANLKQRLQAYDEAGLRVVLAPGASYKSFLISGAGEDEAFLAVLPSDLRRRVRELIPLEETLTPANYIQMVENLIRDYWTHPRIDIWFGPPGPQWVSDELIVQIVEHAERLNTGIQTHALESFYEKLEGPRSYDKPTILHLHELGVLNERFSIAHGVWLTDKEIEVLAETGASVSHNPSSNLRLRAGIAPLNAMLKAGVTVGLGMDGTTINDDEDMFAEMRLALRLHRTPRLNAPAPTIKDIFRIATIGGARLLLHEQELGKIAPGYKADLVLVNLDRIVWPWMAPEAEPLHVVLMRARAADADTVLIDGEVVLHNGKPTRFDLLSLGQEIAEQFHAAPARDEYRALADELRPYLEGWYASWDVPIIKPYAAFNSCI